MLITVVILGKYLECAAKGRTSAAIQALLALAPDTATLVQLDNEGCVTSEDIIHTSLVHHGDLLKVMRFGLSALAALMVASSCMPWGVAGLPASPGGFLQGLPVNLVSMGSSGARLFHHNMLRGGTHKFAGLLGVVVMVLFVAVVVSGAGTSWWPHTSRW